MNETRNRSGLLFGLAYLIIWGLSVAVYWVFMSPSDVMGYTLLFVYILNPVGILVISLLIGMKRTWRKRAWTAPVLFGVAYMLLPYVTFSLGNTVATGNVHAPEIGMALIGAGISAAGLGLGSLGRLAEKANCHMKG